MGDTKLDELEIIGVIRNMFIAEGRYSDFYDDVAYIGKEGGGFYTLKVDMLVEGTDVPPKMEPHQIGRKSVVSCVSDLVAKASKPKGFMISLGIPKEKEDAWLVDLLRGFLLSSKEFDITLLGGDVNESEELVIDCFMFGLANRKIPRSGASVGDLIATVPKFGLPKLGLMHLLYDKPIPKEFEESAIEAVLTPKPPIKLIELIGRTANSSMDSSDGLAVTLNEISRQSKKMIVIDRLPAPENFVEVVESSGFDALDLILYGGEEFQPVFTFNRNLLEEVLEFARKKDVEITIIGEVKEGSGVFIRRNGFLEKVEDLGWRHLTNE